MDLSDVFDLVDEATFFQVVIEAHHIAVKKAKRFKGDDDTISEALLVGMKAVKQFDSEKIEKSDKYGIYDYIKMCVIRAVNKLIIRRFYKNKKKMNFTDYDVLKKSDGANVLMSLELLEDMNITADSFDLTAMHPKDIELLDYVLTHGIMPLPSHIRGGELKHQIIKCKRERLLRIYEEHKKP